MTTSAPLYPNIYTMLVGHPGVGKTRVIHATQKFLETLVDFHVAPTSMSAATLVDGLKDATRFIPRLPGDPLEYNSMTLLVDDWQVFMSEYNHDLVAALTTFYDVIMAYRQTRRTKDIDIIIRAPQLSILAGNTPSKLMSSIPDGAWEEGFCSRLILIFSDERPEGDDFANDHRLPPGEMLHDIQTIYNLVGEFEITDGYKQLVRGWRSSGYKPVPTHPKLIHYNTRRRAHLYKLSMVSSIDRGNSLKIEAEDFDRGLEWLVSAELLMPEVFRSGAIGADAKAMAEIQHLVRQKKKAPERMLIRWVSDRVPTHAVLRVIEIMERNGMIKAVEADKQGLRSFVALDE